MLYSGYTIVFGGREFVTADFLKNSSMCNVFAVNRGDILRDGKAAEDSWIEYADVHDGTYPLDQATEALDFLRVNREELLRLSRFPGVEFRTLNFFGDSDSCSMELDSEDIGLIHELLLRLSIAAI